MSNIVTIKNILFGYEEGKDIFKDFSINIPSGVTSIMGQNGTGKSTLMLIASGRLIPETGTVSLLGNNTNEITNEEELNRLASIIYQNMEFDTDETIGNLLSFVYKSGHHTDKINLELINEIITVMELKDSLNKKTNRTSKGEMQRVVIAFALLYGSPIIFMDEPVFALENHQKDAIFKYIVDFAHKFNISIIFSIHDIDISKKFSDNVILFNKNRTAIIGSKDEILVKDKIEEAYQVPLHLLHEREKLNRKSLLNRDKMNSGLKGKILE
ncbi:MAG: hypothetical protein B6229_08370 [Spirochaetaceae bacterium 4572_7]|nr:MAG: hypothetical protein B6229_08370 [Spirochaetaceae bacterium 4572_7]